MSQELILNKIKLLLNLTKSPNEHEAKNAREMADRLIEKYKIDSEALKNIEEKPPVYTDDTKLYSTIGIESWRSQLALGVCRKYDCYCVQEEAVPVEGLSQYSYFVVGEQEDTSNAMFVYHTLEKQVEELVLKYCIGRGPVYIHSYTEGVVEGIRSSLDWLDFNLEISRPINKPGSANTLNTGNECITKHPGEKEKPLKETVNISGQSLIKDVMAYFKGVKDGNSLYLPEILELAEEGKQPDKLKE